MTTLRYEAELPLDWTQASEFDPERLRALARRNEQLLMLLPALEAPSEPEEELGDPRLQVMGLKLQLLLDLVAELLAKELPVPPAIPVSLGATDVRWRQATPPPDGSRLLVDLYLNPHFPRPLKLPAVVEDVQAVERGFAVTAGFPSMSDGLADKLEKFIFRQHRRQVAEQRRSG